MSEKVEESQTADAAKRADLEAATLAAGLPASFARIKPAQRTTLLELLDTHGATALVDAAKRAHRPENPTMHVHG